MVMLEDMYMEMPVVDDPCNSCQHGEEYLSSKLDRPRSTPNITLQMAIDILWHDNKHATDMKRIIFSIISFAFFATVMFLHIPTSRMYYQHHGISSALSTLGGDSSTDNSFFEIDTIPDIFDWLNNTFIPQVFVSTDYNGDALSELQKNRVAAFNKVFGAVHFEVTSMEEAPCEIPAFLTNIYSSCYDSSSTTTDNLFISMDTNASYAIAKLNAKRESGAWLDFSTQRMTIEIITVNGELRGYAVTRLQFDFNAGGYVQPSASTTSAPLNQFSSATPIMVDALAVLWFSPLVFIFNVVSYIRAYMSARTKRDTPTGDWNKVGKPLANITSRVFPDVWLVVDFFRGPMVICFYVVVVITQRATMDSSFLQKLTALGQGGQSDDETRNDLEYVSKSLRRVTNLTVLLRLVAAATILILGLRILNTFRHHVGLSILTRTMKSAFRSFRAFAVIFVVAFVAFAIAGTVLFGYSVEEFSTLLNAMKSCASMIYGDFDFDCIKDIDYSVAYYWFFMGMETFVLLNLVLAIVVDAYGDEKKVKDQNNCWHFRRVANNVFRQGLARVHDVLWLRFCRSRNCRHQVVFWGRIRPLVLYEALEKLQDTEPMYALLTVSYLNELFPKAREEECEASLEHLAVEQQHKSSHTIQEEGAQIATTYAKSTAKEDSFRSTEVSSIYDSDRSLTNHEAQHGGGIPYMLDIVARLDMLEHKLDILDTIEQKLDELSSKSKHSGRARH